MVNILKRIRNLWRVSSIEVPLEPRKNFEERYKEKLSRRKATIIDLNEKPVFDLKSQEI